MQRTKRQARRIGIGIIGGTILVAGIIMVPYPGPGWLTVFAGLAILATEFSWAQSILDKAQGYYKAWQAWLKRQHFLVRWLFIALTGLVVVLTLWLLNVYGLLADFFNVPWLWVHSPLFS